jgi:hypothetical protein
MYLCDLSNIRIFSTTYELAESRSATQHKQSLSLHILSAFRILLIGYEVLYVL